MNNNTLVTSRQPRRPGAEDRINSVIVREEDSEARASSSVGGTRRSILSSLGQWLCQGGAGGRGVNTTNFLSNSSFQTRHICGMRSSACPAPWVVQCTALL